MTKARVLVRANELHVMVEQSKCPLYKEWHVELVCEAGYVFSGHGDLHGISVWNDFNAPDWKYILAELEDGDVVSCDCEECKMGLENE